MRGLVTFSCNWQFWVRWSMDNHDEIYADFDHEYDDDDVNNYGIDWNVVDEHLPENQWALAGLLDEAVEIEDEGEELPPSMMNEILSQACVTLQDRGRRTFTFNEAMDLAEAMIRNRRREQDLKEDAINIFWDANGNCYFE